MTTDPTDQEDGLQTTSRPRVLYSHSPYVYIDFSPYLVMNPRGGFGFLRLVVLLQLCVGLRPTRVNKVRRHPRSVITVRTPVLGVRVPGHVDLGGEDRDSGVENKTKRTLETTQSSLLT